jgi:3-oxo-5-alpha-steroid 4-dehydrogenase 3
MKYPSSARMHIIAYIFGLSYYVVLSLTVLITNSTSTSGGVLTTILLSPSSSSLSLSSTSISDRIQSLVYTAMFMYNNLTVQQSLGVAVFLVGNVLQLHSHWVLSQLSSSSTMSRSSRQGRTRPSTRSNTSRHVYKIPRGGAFTLVSCPHYLAEIIIYIGLVIIQQGRRGNMWLVLAWVVANLGLAADKTHRWYQRTFISYPKKRKAIIPFVY